MTTSSNSVPSSVANSNLTAFTLSGELKLQLSDIVQALPDKLKSVTRDGSTTEISFRNLNMELTRIYIPPIDMDMYFDMAKFNANYEQAFGYTFPSDIKSQFLFGVEISVINNLPFSQSYFLEEDDLGAFRMLTCLLIGLMFNINIPRDCTCYPKNLNELKAVNAGIGLNCVNIECRNQLKLNPLLYDDLLHSDCSDMVFNAAFVSLNLFAGKNINLSVDLAQQVNQSTTTRSTTTKTTSMDMKGILASFQASLMSMQDQINALSRSTANAVHILSHRIYELDSYAIPIGSILPFSGSYIPDCYYECNGQMLRKQDFPILYEQIKTTYGGNGDLFSLPDMSNIRIVTTTDSGVKFIIKVALTQQQTTNHDVTS